MEASELLTILREDYLDDTFSGWESATDDEKKDQFLWSDSFLLRSLTEAQRQACNRTDFLFDNSSYSITLVDGQFSYAINKKITFIESVTFENRPVTHLSKEEFQRKYPSWRTDTGMTNRSCSYVMRGHTMQLYPTPDTTDAGKIVYLDVFRLPKEDITSTGDEFVIPDEYHRDLIWWVLYEAYTKQDADSYDKEKGLRYLARFEEIFGTYVSSEVRLNQLQENQSLTLRPINYLSAGSKDDDS